MRTALLADIHSNLEALQACLAHARRERADRYAFLGDLVGYGADPLACLEIIAGLAGEGALVVRGNHDAACLGGYLESMHFAARDAIYWTREKLGPAEKTFIASLPLSLEEGECCFVHAGMDQPGHWLYASDAHTVARSFAASAARLFFVGHVHEPNLYFSMPAGAPRPFRPVPGVPVPLSEFRRWFVIVGAAGQPRDGNPAACYAIFDEDAGTLTHHRVPYDHDRAAGKILDAGLPERLAWRLKSGY